MKRLLISLMPALILISLISPANALDMTAESGTPAAIQTAVDQVSAAGADGLHT